MDINMASGLSELVAMLYYAKWFHPGHLYRDHSYPDLFHS